MLKKPCLQKQLIDLSFKILGRGGGMATQRIANAYHVGSNPIHASFFLLSRAVIPLIRTGKWRLLQRSGQEPKLGP